MKYRLGLSITNSLNGADQFSAQRLLDKQEGVNREGGAVTQL